MIRVMITDKTKCYLRCFKRKGISFYLTIIVNILKGNKGEVLDER